MLIEIQILFIVVTIILFILSVYTMEDYPILAIPLIMVGIIFAVLVTYGFWDIDYFYVAYNSTQGNSTPYIYSTYEYYEPFGYVFFALVFVYCMLFVRAGFNFLKQSKEQPGEMDYKKLRR